MIKIRDFKKDDAVVVAELIPQLTKNILEQGGLESRIQKIIEDPQSTCIVAEEDGKILGFAELAWYIIPSKGLVGWVEEVIVTEEARGKGVGKALMVRLLEIAKDLGCNQVKLTASSFVAQKMYESLGFGFKETEVMIKRL